MSCNCGDVDATLTKLLDDGLQLTPAEREQLRAELARCPECYSRLSCEEAARELLRKCCSSTQAPERLRVRITRSLYVARTTLG